MTAKDSLEGKTAVVTGASSGIGRAIAEALGSGGACVFLAGRTLAPMSESKARIERGGGKAEAVVVDVRDPAAVRKLVDRAAEKTGRLDVMVNLHTAMQPAKIGGATEPSVGHRAVSYPLGPNAGITEMLVPAGFVTTVYDPTFELATAPEGRKFYRGKSAATPTTLPAPGLPFSFSFWAEPGMEHVVLKAASAYQAASKRRVSPPAFGALDGEP